jgi:hypothetical protein
MLRQQIQSYGINSRLQIPNYKQITKQLCFGHFRRNIFQEVFNIVIARESPGWEMTEAPKGRDHFVTISVSALKI